MPLEISAGAIIFRKEDTFEYLLLHYQSGHWDFPKGNIEKGEKLEETVRREVKEETGIEDIEFLPDFKESVKYFYRSPRSGKIGAERRKKSEEVFGEGRGEPGKLIFKIVTFFLAETKTKEVKISWEHIGFQWLPYQEAIEQLTFKNAKEILKKANNFLQGKGFSGS